jgi:hypothetical protein
MQRIIAVIMLGSLAMAGVSPLGAQAAAPKPAAPKPAAPKAAAPKPAAAKAMAPKPSVIGGVVVSDLFTRRAVVTAINQPKRTLTLKGARGNTWTIVVSKSVANFPKIKKGDTVSVDVAESMVLEVRKSTASPPKTVGKVAAVGTTTVQPRGHPAVPGVTVEEVTGNVATIDYTSRLISVLGLKGDGWTFKADTSVHNLSEIQKGDQVELRFTDEIAIAVTK